MLQRNVLGDLLPELRQRRFFGERTTLFAVLLVHREMESVRQALIIVSVRCYGLNAIHVIFNCYETSKLNYAFVYS